MPVLPSIAVVYLLDQVLVSGGIAELVFKGAIVACVYLLGFYLLSLSKDEKEEYGGHIRELIFG